MTSNKRGELASLNKLIAVQRQTIKVAQENLDDLMRQRAELTCPHKVGDVIEITGREFNGKKGRVLSVGFKSGRWSIPMLWCAQLQILKKDGSDSAFVGEVRMSESNGSCNE